MTRLLIISDSHGERHILKKIFKQAAGGYDAVIHLGDGYRDVLDFKKDIGEFHPVAGNMDNVFISRQDVPETLMIEKENIRILITHGHRFHVHATMEELLSNARTQGAALALYGHTHDKDLTTRDGIVFFNPGAAKHGAYGIVELDRGKIVKTGHYQVK